VYTLNYPKLAQGVRFWERNNSKTGPTRRIPTGLGIHSGDPPIQ